jgi:SAM-dependent methyltransferase
MALYSQAFYANQHQASMRSALEILPIIFQLSRPKSVVDVGCGVGPWLAAARKLGAQEILGIDGDWVDPDALLIPKECFLARDLTKPLDVGRTFDLVMCVEVAEHLPQANAPILVESLVRLAPLVLFSAAIPDQRGLHHVNEQWPQYWKGLFGSQGYHLLDCIRSQVWENSRVEPWYAQNCFAFVQAEYSAKSLSLQPSVEHSEFPLAAVHPRLFRDAATLANVPLRELIKVLPGVLGKTIANRGRWTLSGVRRILSAGRSDRVNHGHPAV